MAYTHRDSEGASLGGNPLPPSEATPRPYSPEHWHEHANPPPPPNRVPAVSVLQCITLISSMTTLFLRSHLPWIAPVVTPNGTDQRCTRAFRTSAIMASRCHMSMIWLAATAFGLTCSRVLRLRLRRERQRRALPPLLSDPRRSEVFFYRML